MRNRQKGFSLIELLIVVAIILIIAAIAIPNLLKSRMAANEASAVGSLRTMNTALVTYASTYPDAGFPAALTQLAAGNTCATAGLLDPVMSAGNSFSKSGYDFAYALNGGGGNCGVTPPNPGADYSITAKATVQDKTGIRGFFTDSSGVIRGKVGGVAGPADNPI